ncbi:undecaprenyl-diphosphate phosphatase [Methanocaldococcus indicus]|uniref:undecaprenyl-diphosphate phosphatase n=1 Tax=Methanocaldococcus indicus TaxID=213231 RepID=UPI003C6DA559
MNLLDVLILSFVEGVTEFLPISSTGHLIVISYLMNIKSNITFDIVIQLGAILAVIYEYSNYLKKDLDIWIKVLISFIPIGILGFLLNDFIEKYLFNPIVVSFAFIVGGIIFIIVEKYYKEENRINNLKDISYKKAFFIGIFQAFSLIPGTSRSGATIIGGLLLNLNRKVAVEFSFLSAIPVMVIASLYIIVKNYHSLNFNEKFNILLGFILSFVIALITIRIFLRYIKNHSFVIFGIYRILFGILILLLYYRILGF